MCPSIIMVVKSIEREAELTNGRLPESSCPACPSAFYYYCAADGPSADAVLLPCMHACPYSSMHARVAAQIVDSATQFQGGSVVLSCLSPLDASSSNSRRLRQQRLCVRTLCSETGRSSRQRGKKEGTVEEWKGGANCCCAFSCEGETFSILDAEMRVSGSVQW